MYMNDSNTPAAGSSNDALKAGGIVKISEDLLKEFANKNLESFIKDIAEEPSLQALSLFANGGSGASSGPMPSGSYDQLLPGNGQSGSSSSGSNSSTGK